MGAIAEIDVALQALAQATTPVEFIRIANTAESLRVYARRARWGLEAQNRCCEIRLLAERRLGESLAAWVRAGRPKMVTQGDHIRLADIGVTKRLSSRAQALANVPAWVFDSYIGQVCDDGDELTARGLLNHAERQTQPDRNRENIVGGRVGDLLGWARTNRAGCILIDPAWRIRGSVLPYETVDAADLKALPIPALANPKRCHIHIWTLPNASLWAAKEIVESWRFRVVSVLTWAKSGAPGRGNYWRMDTEFLVSAVNTDADRFDDKTLRGWREEPRLGHSRKPDVFYSMVEAASPPPRLELFARELRPHWYSWGHQIAGGVAAVG
jgi:N6-adenosine-specific RNA methylase IME4